MRKLLLFFLLLICGYVVAQPLAKKNIWGKWYLDKMYFNGTEIFNAQDSLVTVKSIWTVNARLDSVQLVRYKKDTLNRVQPKTYSASDSLREYKQAIKRFHELKEVFFELYQNGTYRQAKLVIIDSKKSKFNYGKYTFDVNNQTVKDSRVKEFQLKVINKKLVLELTHGKESMVFEFAKKHNQ